MISLVQGEEIFKPYQIEQDPVKEAGEKGKKTRNVNPKIPLVPLPADLSFHLIARS